MKKKYVTPECEVVHVKTSTPVFSGSGSGVGFSTKVKPTTIETKDITGDIVPSDPNDPDNPNNWTDY